MAGGKWYDGLVDERYLYKSGDMVKITEVTEYLNMDATCSLSYYECLAKRFATFDYSKAKNKSFAFGKCRYERPHCAPFSLPFDHENKMALCREMFRDCYLQIIDDLQVDQRKYCQKACRVEEFKRHGIPKQEGINFDSVDSNMELYFSRSDWRDWVSKTWNLSAIDADSTIVVGYKFELPDFNRDPRSDEPYKTVKREYLIITWISMIGTVGGTLGMFVGFSLIGTSKWLSGCIRSIVLGNA